MKKLLLSCVLSLCLGSSVWAQGIPTVPGMASNILPPGKIPQEQIPSYNPYGAPVYNPYEPPSAQPPQETEQEAAARLLGNQSFIFGQFHRYANHCKMAEEEAKAEQMQADHITKIAAAIPSFDIESLTNKYRDGEGSITAVSRQVQDLCTDDRKASIKNSLADLSQELDGIYRDLPTLAATMQ